MKKIIQSTLLIAIISFSSCAKKTTVIKKTSTPAHPSSTAPGQIKKVTGSQSAAAYAPGHQKKAQGATPSKTVSKAKGKKSTEGKKK